MVYDTYKTQINFYYTDETWKTQMKTQETDENEI